VNEQSELTLVELLKRVCSGGRSIRGRRLLLVTTRRAGGKRECDRESGDRRRVSFRHVSSLWRSLSPLKVIRKAETVGGACVSMFVGGASIMAKIRAIDHPPQEVRAALRHGGFLNRLTKIGFISKGAVYLLVGLLALMLATVGNGETTDAQGAVRHIANQPFGTFAMMAVAAGLLAFAVWQFICAVFNTEREKADLVGRLKRVVYFCSGIAHSALSFYAINVLLGHAEKSDQTRAWTVRLMQVPAGTWLVMLVGVILIVSGGIVIRGAFKKNFLKNLRTGEMSRTELRWATRAGTWGNAARGLIFAIIGFFMLSAGWWENPLKAKGFEGALDTLARQPLGNFLLGAVALGLALFGVFSLVEARYRKIRA
jgi:hypothetical protein